MLRKFKYLGKLIQEFFAFAKQNKIYWILPLVIVFILIFALVVAGQVSTPFLYTFF